MDELKQALDHLEAAELALHQADPDEPFEDKKERVDSLVHISHIMKKIRNLYDRKMVRKNEV